MQILAIETVGRTGSVAALDDDRVILERPLDARRRSAQTLAPAIADLLSEVGWQAPGVELVAVAEGPGSFTGLRIGVTTAKAFAYAVRCAIVGVPTVAAIAERVPGDVERFSIVIDAERGELFAADFARGADREPSGQAGVAILAATQWLARLTPGMFVTGPGLEKVIDQLPDGVTALDAALWNPTAAAVGRVGWRMFAAGRRSDAFELVPQYHRRTAAEERRSPAT